MVLIFLLRHKALHMHTCIHAQSGPVTHGLIKVCFCPMESTVKFFSTLVLLSLTLTIYAAMVIMVLIEDAIV